MKRQRSLFPLLGGWWRRRQSVDQMPLDAPSLEEARSEAALESASLEASPARSGPPRRLHLGVDYGTAWSKLVLRDLTSPRGDEAFVLRPDPPVTLRVGEFRIPSVVASGSGRLWFAGSAEARIGRDGVRPYYSLKIRAAELPCFGLEEPMPHGLSEMDAATLFVGYLIALGRLAAAEYGRRQGSESTGFGFTLGVPATFADSPELRTRFATLARRAACLSVDLEAWTALGLELDEARDALVKAAAEDAAQASREPEWRGARAWIRNEAVAALHWGFRSPRLGEGLYAAIDVGAGTTNAAWFRIVSSHNGVSWEKSHFAFFGSACRPPGVDRIDQELARAVGSTENPASFRDRESEVLESLPHQEMAGLRRAAEEVFEVARLSFQRAYPKQAIQSAFEESRLLLFGGGARIRWLISYLKQPHSRNGWPTPLQVGAGVPADLKDWGKEHLKADHDLLLVAYGLSFPPGDVPEVIESGSVEDWKPRSPDQGGNPDQFLWYLDAG